MSLQSFRLSMRFVVPLGIVLTLFAYAVVPLMDNLTLRWFVRDLDIRTQFVAGTLEEPLAEFASERSKKKIASLFDRALRDERLYALAFCDPAGNVIYKTSTYPDSVACRMPPPNADSHAKAHASIPPSLVRLPQGSVHVGDSPIYQEGQYLGKLILVHDMSFIERRSADTREYVILLFVALAIVISLLTVFIAHLSWRGWIKAVKDLLRGENVFSSKPDTPPDIQPLMGDLRALMRQVNMERQLQTESATNAWNPERLRALLHEELSGDEVLVVSNREPYIHTQTPNGLEVQRPASGLVTAVEPVMRACSGTWIAHGGGSGDRQTVDKHDRVPVPPGNPSYTLRRVWLTKEEEQGYYYGFANEGLWPLCHIAHVRPVFRSTDWEQYVEVNRRFADAVIDEARTENPVILIQDYHFALLPKMVREALPKATIITFWHIPWPNPESFGILPWRKEILEGLLGSTILGFHTPFHCQNFIHTVDRYMEARIEHDTSTISYCEKMTQVQAYPISIAWPDAVEHVGGEDISAEVRKELGMSDEQLLGVGVDRLDYTKGIIERFQAIERMFELHPSMIGRFYFLQIAAPSRSSLEEYQNFEGRVRTLASRINTRFGSTGYEPIILRTKHHGPEQINRYYRAANVCLVTSLHDGMNLVAKEFIASRDDDQGVLVLSQFTGAARELPEALIVNPYHIEQSAAALYRALVMPEVEQRERMRCMRSLVKEFNVYRWAGHMLMDAARLRRRERVTARIHAHGEHLRRVI
jgi:trehalose-6-phosphate synthase